MTAVALLGEVGKIEMAMAVDEHQAVSLPLPVRHSAGTRRCGAGSGVPGSQAPRSPACGEVALVGRNRQQVEQLAADCGMTGWHRMATWRTTSAVT